MQTFPFVFNLTPTIPLKGLRTVYVYPPPLDPLFILLSTVIDSVGVASGRMPHSEKQPPTPSAIRLNTGMGRRS